MKHARTLFVFRQDLRLYDNVGLRHAILDSQEIIPVFIFDETILSQFPKEDARIGFLIDAINKLDAELRERGSYLHIEYGDPVKKIPELIKKHKADALFHNKSYGSGSLSRDKAISEWCIEHSVTYKTFDDFLLVPVDAVEQRKVFSAFFKLWQKVLANSGVEVHHAPTHIQSPVTDHTNKNEIYKKLSYSESITRKADAWEKRIDSFHFSSYDETRNFPAIDGSSKMSPYIRFGLISIRKLYRKALHENAQVYISELARREFRHHIMHYFPETKRIEFLEKRRNLAWDNNEKHFKARKEGKTGYPLIDAGMRQLKAENWMHNRVRMVVASFLTKDLMIDRRRGEEHFKNYLLDYDENVNIGNRQRAASVGADPKPLRIFSPMLQSERFDPKCEYIKKWIPELKDVDPKFIHQPLDNDLSIYGYTKPCVDHYERSKKAKEMYKKE